MSTQERELQALQLGALLHDTGKLFQRSGLRHSQGYNSFSAQDHGAHGAHAKWSADFVERHVSPRWPLKPHDVLTHHLSPPPSRTACIIALADRMAAGEREEDEGQDARPWESQLLSIFSRLRGERDQPANHDGYYPLAPLALSRDVIFPRKERLSSDRCRDGYLALWRGFENDFARLEQPDFDGYLEAAYHLLQRYGWCVPSAAYRQTPDVSLFDHSRLACAIATCLHLDGPSDARLGELLAWPARAARSEPLLLLVGGDLSGLQDYLYTLASRGAARTLRGRSAYLQLLAESAARFLLDRLGLATPNLIYCGGGHFYLLAPLSGEKALEEAAADVEGRVLALHGGDMGLAIGHAPLSMDDFQSARFALKRSEMSARVGLAKNRRFGRVLRQSYSLLFDPSGSGGAGQRCEACHAEIAGPAQEEPRCPACQGMEELGREIARVASSPGTLLSVGKGAPVEAVSWWQRALGQFGCWWSFDPTAPGSLRYSLNDTDFVAAGAHGFRWIPAVVPKIADAGGERTKGFEEIARDSVGIDRLGVLRMDMDDLGALFARGLGGMNTASRVASLSSTLRTFFEGWINRVCLEVERDSEMVPAGSVPRKGLLYGVYSGGDDLFIVGAWDVIPRLARRVRAELGDFAMGNPAVRISAGIALVDHHHPLYQSAKQAKEALEQGSKQYSRRDGRAKDAVTLLGETLAWEEFDSLDGQVAQMARLLGTGGGGRLHRSLLSLLGALHTMYREEVARQKRVEGRLDPERGYYGRWNWMAAYGLSRARERTRDEEARGYLAALEKRLAEPGGIERLGLVARWAEYLTRSREAGRR